MGYVLGIDVGTTGTKAMLVNGKGDIVVSTYKGYDLFKPGRCMVEQRAEDWWDAFVTAVRECTKNIINKQSIIAISVSSQGASLIPVDENCSPLSNVIVWMDRRGNKQQEDLLKLYSDEFFYRKTGWKLTAGGNLIQINWMNDNRKDIFDKTFKFLSTIEYINYKLTGRYVTDPTNGGMTQLMNILTGDWDDKLVEAAGIGKEKLAEIEQSGELLGNLLPSAAEQLGLSTSTKVINGGHDQYCVAVGTGVIHEGELLLSTGTAWIVLGTFAEPVFDTNTYIAPGRHIVKDLWGALASSPTGGVSMEWFKDNFALKYRNDHTFESESFREIDLKASVKLKKAEGVFFYPYYNGSGYPHWNSTVKASLLGIGLEHDRYDIALAIMEGLAFESAWGIEEFKKKGCKAKRLRMLGGASKSELWSDIIANVTGTPVIRLKEADAACMGAAILAGMGCGMFDNYDDGYMRVSGGEIYTEPDSSKVEFYREKFEKYKKGLAHIEGFYER